MPPLVILQTIHKHRPNSQRPLTSLRSSLYWPEDHWMDLLPADRPLVGVFLPKPKNGGRFQPRHFQQGKKRVFVVFFVYIILSSSNNGMMVCKASSTMWHQVQQKSIFILQLSGMDYDRPFGFLFY
jgi:hypothetical protein